jgi:dipeptidyl-peptidase-4
MAWPSLADLSRPPIPGTEGPSAVRFSPDGSAVTYLLAEPGSLVNALWLYELESGERRRLAIPVADHSSEEDLSHQERLERERTRTSALGVTEYAWLGTAQHPVLLVPVAGGAYVASGPPERGTDLHRVAGIEGATRVVGSPDGRLLAFVRDGDIWSVPVEGGRPARLTDDAEDGVSNGLAEYAAAEELDRFDGLWWSTDGRHLAYANVDERALPKLAIAHLGDAAPMHEEHRYPFAGGPNARVSLRIVSSEGGAWLEAALPMADGDYLARVVADPTGGWLAAILPREQRALHWFRVAPNGAVAPLWSERSTPWLNLDNDTRVLPDGRVLRTTERTGFRHLELHDANGQLAAQLTSGEWMVTEVVHVDVPGAQVYFMGTAHGATERHLYRVPLQPGQPVTAPERLTPEPGWHSAAFSRDGTGWTDLWSNLQASSRLVARSTGAAGGSRRLVDPLADASGLGVPPPELLELTAADGQTPLRAAFYAPPTAGEQPPPCVVWVYGGAHAQYAKRAWEATAHPLRQYLARLGVAVLVVDGRGSAFRGLQFEAGLATGFGTLEVEDQATAVRALAIRGRLDPERVGITGGSYGGYMTIRAMALEPDLFKVGVAVAPVTAWDGYDTAYTERYLGQPDQQREAYDRSSLLQLAPRLTGSLLLIHGGIDENVHLRHSVQLLAALEEAGRDVELVILPFDRHRVRNPAGLATRDRRTVRHLLRGLGVPLPDELSEQGS